MAEEFKVINTQEELNAVISERIKRIETKHSEETAGLRKEIETLTAGKKENETKVADLTKKLADSEAKVKNYEATAVKVRIAKEVGIPESFADRLRGATEEELKKDAESLKTSFPHYSAPGKSTSAAEGSNSKESKINTAFAALAHGLTSNE